MSKQKSNKTIEQLQKVLTQYAQEANEWAHFSERRSALTEERFVQTLVLGWLRQKGASLNQLAHYAKDLGIQITGAALQERINQKAVMLLAGVLNGVLQHLPGIHTLPLKQLAQFQGIYITDSTQIALPQALAPVFKGNKDNSMLKLQVAWDYLQGHVVALELEAGKSPDQNCHLPVSLAQAGSLQLFDLGYFKQEYLRDIAGQGAFFVSRYQAQTALYSVESTLPFALVPWLKTCRSIQAECALLVGERVKLPVRLLVRRLPSKAAQARRRQAKKKARKQGKTCSASYLYLLGWDIMLTNLPVEEWSLLLVFDLYSIRFQIEWLFRCWKDGLGVATLGNWHVERVLCQLYAHLLGAILTHLLTAAWRWREVEYSLLKTIQIIQAAVPDWMRCLRHAGWGFATWFNRLEEDFQAFGRKTQRRKSPSTTQILYNWGLS